MRSTKNNIYEENNITSGEKSKNHLPWNQAINEIREFFGVYSNNKLCSSFIRNYQRSVWEWNKNRMKRYNKLIKILLPKPTLPLFYLLLTECQLNGLPILFIFPNKIFPVFLKICKVLSSFLWCAWSQPLKRQTNQYAKDRKQIIE